MFDAWLGLLPDLKRSLVLDLWRWQAILDVNCRHCSFSPEALAQFRMMKRTAPDRGNSPDGTFCGSIRLILVWNCELLFDALFLVESLDRGCREFTRSVVSDKLHLLVELHLHRHDIHLDARFTFRLVSEA